MAKALSGTLLFKIYDVLVFPLFMKVMRFLGKFNSKISLGLKMRESVDGISPWLRFPQNQKPIWIHCASGEFEYAKPVIKRLKAKTQTPILVTYFSPSIKKAIENFQGVDMSCPLPWDKPEDWKAFILHHQPQALLIARTDTWPQMLRQAKLHSIPTLLFAATLVENSGRARGLSRYFSKIIFSYLDTIYCVSEEDKEIFAKLGRWENTFVAGDTRYDQVVERLKNPKIISPFVVKPSTPTFVAGSTWPEDEAVLLPTLASLKGPSYKNQIRTVLVPHEPHLDHIKELEMACTRLGLTHDRYSKLKSVWDSEVLIVDQIGILAELYLIGSVAFVGGSFRKTVHSVMEPLAAGCYTILGPLHKNNREALSFQTVSTSIGIPMVLAAQDKDDFAKKMKVILELSPEVLKESQIQIQNEILKRSQKSDQVVTWALNHS